MAGHDTGCLICGSKLKYDQQETFRSCAICGKSFLSNAACAQGHFVCDGCHATGLAGLLHDLQSSKERDPLALFEGAIAAEGVHMHGPEHHTIVPAVLLTAYRNNGGNIDLPVALAAAAQRAGNVPGGACGFWGVCGAATGAGIYASVLLNSSPLNAEAWGVPMQLVSRCLALIGELGGPRCCKRTSRMAIEAAAAFTKEHFGVEMPLAPVICAAHEKNAECILGRCPYFGEGERKA